MPGGGGSSQPTKTTQTVKQELSPEQRKLLGLAFPKAQQFARTNLELYPGDTVVDPNALQQQSQNQLVQSATGGIQDTINQSKAAHNFSLGGVLYPGSNPALQSATEAAIRPITEEYTQSVLPNIRNNAAQAGQVGSSRQGVAEGMASRDFMRQVGDTAAQMQNENYQKGLDVFSRGMLLSPQMAQLQTVPSQLLGAVGTQQQGQEQAELNALIQRHGARQMLPLLAAQELSSLAGSFGGGGTTSTAIGPTLNQPSGLMMGLGGAASGAAMGSTFGPWGTAVGGALGLMSSFF